MTNREKGTASGKREAGSSGKSNFFNHELGSGARWIITDEREDVFA